MEIGAIRSIRGADGSQRINCEILSASCKTVLDRAPKRRELARALLQLRILSHSIGGIMIDISGRIRLVVVVFLCLTAVAAAQETSGNINGRVNDESGAVIPGV